MLSMQNVSKSFSGVYALKDVDLDLKKGEVHALVGENGAGKSTLMKILAGVQGHDEGTITLDGEQVNFSTVAEARSRGIVMVYQELMLFPDLSVAENLFIGTHQGIVNHRRLLEQAREHLSTVDLAVDPAKHVRELGIGEQQLVEIASALVHDSRILIMDEPTAALTAAESDRLFSLIQSLKSRGVSIIYISHRLEEIFRLADRVTVLRDGRLVATHDIADVSPDTVIQQMVGRSVLNYSRERLEPGEDLGHFEFEGPRLSAGELRLHKGEIVGLAGVIGSGRSTVLDALFGLTGTASWNGKPVLSPLDALRRGLVLVPGDRKSRGIVPELASRENISLAILRQLSRFGVLNGPAERAQAGNWIERLSLRPPDARKPAGTFSGGNQQKIVVGKMLATEPDVLLLDEPTRGVDVGARAELYELISELARGGLGLIVGSSDTSELISLCDRILVFRDGSIATELHAPFVEEEVVSNVTGASQLA